MKLRYAARARADIADIHAFISERNPRAAKSVIGRIRATAGQLARTPGFGRETDIDGVSVFTANSYPYMIYYTVTDCKVAIVHIRHGARAAPTSNDF